MYEILGGNIPENNVKISENLFEELVFDFLNSITKNGLIKKYLTFDKNVILERQKIFRTLYENREFADFLEEFLGKLEDLMNLKQNNKKYMLRESGDNERAFSEFRELMFFTECIDIAVNGAEKFGGTEAFGRFSAIFERSVEIAESEWYKNAKLYIGYVSDELKNIKSVGLGINLDAKLCVKEVGLVSFNSEYYRTNSLFDKMFSKNIGNKEYICIAPISGETSNHGGYSLEVFNNALYRTISSVLGNTVKKTRKKLYDMLCDNTEFLLCYYDDMKFISFAYRYILNIRSRGLPLVFPEISEEYIVNGLYNPNLLGNMKSIDIVKNDFSFDENGEIYLLIGANSGGKTVFLRSVGIAQVLFQLGLPIPAVSAKMQLYKNIFSHFSSKTKDINGGRFENECKAIMEFYGDVTEDTLLLLDEMFSTTSSFEGEILASYILEKMAKCGCKCIYTTHMHNLTYKIDEINVCEENKSRIDVLSADISNGVCTYKIIRKRGMLVSFAEAIFRKYGFGE